MKQGTCDVERETRSPELSSKENFKVLTLSGAISYAIPTVGLYFFYVPMWSVLPGFYAKYFHLELTSIATVVLIIRLFDGIADTTIGYVSDVHRSAGGSRIPWVAGGGIGSFIACYFLFIPEKSATVSYYLLWSLLYFLSYTASEIPHTAWGGELAPDYHLRARIYGLRSLMSNLGVAAFYTLPLLPLYPSRDYTPQVMHDAAFAGTIITLGGLLWMIIGRVPTKASTTIRHSDSFACVARSVVRNKPLILYFSAFGCVGVCYGMWFGLVYLYIDSYLMMGRLVASMFLVGTLMTIVSTPFWIELICRTNKSTAWAIGLGIFVIQLVGMSFANATSPVWIPFVLVIVAHLCFCCHNVAALSILGDIVDFAKLKFQRDRGATYFGVNTLIFKFGLGIGGAASLSIAGLFEFTPSSAAHSGHSIIGLKLGFIILPICFALVALPLILRTPIDERRYHIIQRRLRQRVLTTTSRN